MYQREWQTDPVIAQALAEVGACIEEGLANCRRGRHDLGVLGVDSPVAARFNAAYDRWMTLRARAGDHFARSLGYGRTPAPEAA